MELKILSPQEGGFVKEIQWNNEELKAEIAEKMQEYKTLVFTEETIKEAKADRSRLNKLRTAFEDERKRIKKLCMAPYDAFERQVKEVVALIDEPIGLIDRQIKEVEEQKRIEKKGKILEFYEISIGTLKGILPFDKVFKAEYLNVSRSLKSIMEEIDALISRVNTDLNTIEGFGSKYEFQIKDVYLRTLDLSSAMQEKARLEAVEQRLMERKQEEERRASERRKAEQEAAQREAAEKESIAQCVPAAATEVVTEEVSQPDPVENQSAQEEMCSIDFRVWGTREQIMALRQYMIDNKIKFGKVE